MTVTKRREKATHFAQQYDADCRCGRPEKVKTLLETELDYLDERHAQDRAFYDKASAYAPAFGVIGTLMGLINLLKSLDDPDAIAPAMALALVTTFYGTILSNLIFTPISNKLRVRHEEEYLCK